MKSNSVKTTWAGYMLLAGMVLVAAGKFFDGNSATDPVEELSFIIKHLEEMGVLAAGLGGALLGIFSRDDDVSSENVARDKKLRLF